MTLHDAAGRRMRTVADGLHPAGLREWLWDDRGKPQPAGIYLIQVRSPGFHRTSKLTLVR